jgi:hypothetical protein
MAKRGVSAADVGAAQNRALPHSNMPQDFDCASEVAKKSVEFDGGGSSE